MKLTSKVGLAALALVVASLFTPSKCLSKEVTKGDSELLTKDNLLVLNSEVNGESVAALISKARELCSADTNSISKKVGFGEPTHLKLFLNSPGGSVQAGFELQEALNGLGCPIDTITLFSASMAFQLAQSFGERLILKNGVFMSHHAYGEMQGEFGGSIKSQMENRQQLWIDRIRELDEQTVKRTKGKQTYESYTKQYDHELWLTGTKSVEQGYADRVVTVKCDASLSGNDTHHINLLGFDISYDLDNCPLNTTPMNIKINAPGMFISTPVISVELEALIKSKFLEQYTNKQKQIIPFY